MKIETPRSSRSGASSCPPPALHVAADRLAARSSKPLKSSRANCRSSGFVIWKAQKLLPMKLPPAGSPNRAGFRAASFAGQLRRLDRAVVDDFSREALDGRRKSCWRRRRDGVLSEKGDRGIAE